MREKILVETAKIMAQEGLDRVTTRSVCDRVGIKAPTLYYYFKDKNELIESVTKMAYDRYSQKHLKFSGNKSPARELIAIWNVYFDFVEQETEFYLAIVRAHADGRIPQAGQELFQSTIQVFEKAYKIKKLPFAPKMAAQIYYSMACGAALLYLSQKKNKKMLPGIKTGRNLCIKNLLN